MMCDCCAISDFIPTTVGIQTKILSRNPFIEMCRMQRKVYYIQQHFKLTFRFSSWALSREWQRVESIGDNITGSIVGAMLPSSPISL